MPNVSPTLRSCCRAIAYGFSRRWVGAASVVVIALPPSSLVGGRESMPTSDGRRTVARSALADGRHGDDSQHVLTERQPAAARAAPREAERVAARAARPGCRASKPTAFPARQSSTSSRLSGPQLPAAREVVHLARADGEDGRRAIRGPEAAHGQSYGAEQGRTARRQRHRPRDDDRARRPRRPAARAPRSPRDRAGGRRRWPSARRLLRSPGRRRTRGGSAVTDTPAMPSDSAIASTSMRRDETLRTAIRRTAFQPGLVSRAEGDRRRLRDRSRPRSPRRRRPSRPPAPRGHRRESGRRSRRARPSRRAASSSGRICASTAAAPPTNAADALVPLIDP